MPKINWLPADESEILQEQVRQKIATIQTFEDEIPAVLIIHDIEKSSVVYMSRRGRDILGVSLDEIRVNNAEYHARFFNPEDASTYVPLVFGLIEQNNDNLVSYLQQVRHHDQHQWSWYLSNSKIFMRGVNGKPRLLITIAMPMATDHPVSNKVEKLLDENNFLKKNQHIFSTLTKREKEVLAMIAKGDNSQDIAAKLNMSTATANTHRRNIRNKIQAQSSYDMMRFAQAFDLV